MKTLQNKGRGKYFCTVRNSLVTNYCRVQLRPRIKVERNTKLHDPLKEEFISFPEKKLHRTGKTKLLTAWSDSSVLGYLHPSVKRLLLAAENVRVVCCITPSDSSCSVMLQCSDLFYVCLCSCLCLQELCNSVV